MIMEVAALGRQLAHDHEAGAGGRRGTAHDHGELVAGTTIFPLLRRLGRVRGLGLAGPTGSGGRRVQEVVVRMVRTVQAPTQIRSPSCSGTRTPPGISPPLTIVPFAEPGSSTTQLPSDSAIRTACRWETPGSAGGPVRSISGSSPRDALRRPMRISWPDKRNLRSGQ